MEIYLASNNKNKIIEIKDMFKDNYEIVPISNILKSIEVEENGKTFIENSVIKAVTIGNKINKPVIADDSGLCIESLNLFPGVKSARFMKKNSYEEKMKELIYRLKDKENLGSFFSCAATFFDPIEKILVSFEGIVKGKISKEIRGNKGFGYDPFFIPDGYNRTFGELGDEIKNKISHRYKAFKGLFELINKL